MISFHLAQLDSGYTLKDIALQFLASPEYRAKADVAPATMTREAPQAPSGAPPDLQILIATGDGLSKVAEQVAGLKAMLGPRDLISILDGSVGKIEDDGILEPDRVELIRVPGSSVFHLRQRIPSVAKDRRWIALLEDHNLLDADWVTRVRAILSRSDAATTAVFGTFTNRFAKGGWSWANFLITFARHWHPIEPQNARMTLIGNVIFRRDRLPANDFKFGQFENDFLPRIMDGAVRSDDIPVDHCQSCGFARATALQFHNARVAGACMRIAYPDATTGLRRGLRRFLVEQVPEAIAIARRHPAGSEIPRLTGYRMKWLSLAIAAGFVWGSCFGYGRSPWRLE